MKKTKKHIQVKTISTKQNILKILFIPFLIIFSIILLKNAWVGDDAYITFRTIDNFVNGHGLTWNTIDRVQTYTHPLWMFLMTFLYLLTGEFFLTVIAFSFVLTILAVLLVTREIAKNNGTVLLVLLALMLSKSFVDYSISGLENPLIHLFIALFAYNFFKYETNPDSLFMLSLIAGLACLNRMDTILFFVPALIFAFWKIRSVKNFFIILAGFSPFIIWELFSLWYYGFLFPNTAYAKLSTGIGRGDLIFQGIAYLKNALIMDPLSVIIILCGFVVTFILKERRKLSLSIGILLYLVYVVYIGGDFMSGRFLAAPLFCSVILLIQCKLEFTRRTLTLIGVIILILGLVSPHSPVYRTGNFESESDLQKIIDQSNGIADEKAHYFAGSSLLNYNNHDIVPNHKWAKQGQEVSRQGTIMVTKSAIGYFGYFAGPNVHIMDDLGLADPLLARLPVPDPKNWRIGHFRRHFPNGYLQSLRYNTNAIKDTNLHKYYDKLKILTRGELFSLNRIYEIIKFTLGRYNHFLEAYDDTPVDIIDIDDYNKKYASDTTTSAKSYFTIPKAGIQLAFGEIKLASQIEVELDSDDDYILVFLNTHVEVFDKIIPATKDTTGIMLRLIDIPASVLIEGYDGLRIYPYNGDDIFRLGRIRFID